jgi:hypothetical protein
VMHGTPRPVDASVARPGMPTLALAVSDVVVDAVVLHKHTAGILDGLQLGPCCSLYHRVTTCNVQAPRWARSGCMTRRWIRSLGREPVTRLWSGTAKQQQQQQAAAAMATAKR